MITVSAFRLLPETTRGLGRDLRVRWALEEVGLAYETWLITQDEKNSPAYRDIQPFGQIPAFEEDGLVLFESGAIVHHIALKSDVLMPRDEKDRARTMTWMYAALTSIEPHLQNLRVINRERDQEWAKLRLPAAMAIAEARLDALSKQLDGKDYLVANRFTAADLLMVTVLHMARHWDIVAKRPVLESYRLRCEARPAYQRALAAHMAAYEGSPAVA